MPTAMLTQNWFPDIWPSSSCFWAPAPSYLGSSCHLSVKMSTLMCNVETFRVDSYMVQEVIFKISAKSEHENIPVVNLKFWAILHSKIVIFGHFQVSIEHSSRRRSELRSISKCHQSILIQLWKIFPYKIFQNVLCYWVRAHFWSPKIDMSKYGISSLEAPNDLETPPMNAGHLVYF